MRGIPHERLAAAGKSPRLATGILQVRSMQRFLLLAGILSLPLGVAATSQAGPDAAEISEQAKVQAALMRVVTKPTTIEEMGERVDAVRFLGAHGVAEAVPFLVDRLTKITPFETDNYLNFDETYPASVALAQIGEPAVKPLQALFEKSRSGEDQLVIVHTLLKIKGKAWTASYLAELNRAGKSVIPSAGLEELKAWVNSLRDN